MSSEQPYVLHGRRSNRPVSLIICWTQSAGGVSNRVIDHLNRELWLEVCGEIKSERYFQLSGVEVKNDVIQFPESKFYKCRAKNILIFESDVPNHSQYEFINTVIDFTQDYCKLNEFLTIGEIVTATGPEGNRRMSAVVNQSKLKKSLSGYEIDTDIDFQTPVGSVPTLNSYSLWIAQQRDVAALNVWIDVPFYLAAVFDTLAVKQTLGFLNNRYKLGLNLTNVDEEADKLKGSLAELMKQNSDISRLMGLLSRGISLTRNEGEMLAKEVSDFLLENN